MPNYTDNINLILPKKSENYDVETANTNNRIIDGKIAEKVDKVTGKGLSTNDFTNGYKNKLDTLENYDDTDIKTDITNIKTEQATQNTNITTNTTEISKLKSENELLKSQIPTRQNSRWKSRR